MKSVVQKITPKQAQDWLSKANYSNRTLRPGHINFLANEMATGHWRTSHQGIAFAENGRLLDGQHRLHAIVKYGKPVEILVTTGMEDDDFKVIDCGLKRANFERIFLVNDLLQNRLICMAIRLFIEQTGSKENTKSISAIEDEFLSKCEAWQWMGAECAKLPTKLRKAGIMAALAIYHFTDKEKATEFVTGYRSGTDLAMGSPVLRLRNDALTGHNHDVNYWRVQSMMRSHMHGKSAVKIFEASEDMLGNKNSVLLIRAREKKGIKGNATKLLNKAG